MLLCSGNVGTLEKSPKGDQISFLPDELLLKTKLFSEDRYKKEEDILESVPLKFMFTSSSIFSFWEGGLFFFSIFLQLIYWVMIS